MSWVAAAAIGLALAYFALQALSRAEPASLARILRLTLPLALATLGGTLMVLGRAGVGGSLMLAALAWLAVGWVRPRRANRALAKRTLVRTAALEIEIDPSTGAVSGLVLAGRFEGQTLARLTLDQLRALRRELASDPESVRLVETYLDGRFPVWREDA